MASGKKLRASAKAGNPKAKAKKPSQPKKALDWERIEVEYTAGQLTVAEIGRRHGCTHQAISKRAGKEAWQRTLADRTRKATREKLIREDAGCGNGCETGCETGCDSGRITESAIVEAAALRGFELVISHRKDIQQLHEIKRILATRLMAHLNGETPEGAYIGERETPGDLLEKLSRVTSRLIPLERQAHNLDEARPEADSIDKLMGAIDGAGWQLQAGD